MWPPGREIIGKYLILFGSLLLGLPSHLHVNCQRGANLCELRRADEALLVDCSQAAQTRHCIEAGGLADCL